MKLVDVSQQTRENAAYALKCLCKRHHSFIKEELAKAKSDGSLLSLSDINIESILAKGQVLRGRGKVEETVIDNEIHNKRWLRIQRKLLREKLGLESNEEVSVAAKYTEEYLDLINRSDLVADVHIQQNCIMVDIASEKNLSASIEKSEEVWIVKILRNMVVRLLDFRWETRQGSSLGLIAIIESVVSPHSTPPEEIYSSPSSSSSSSSILSYRKGVEYLPKFLLEDIAATSICVLMLDRFIEFDDSVTFKSPVKDAAANLIAFCCYGGDKDGLNFTKLIIGKILAMSSYSQQRDIKKQLNKIDNGGDTDGWHVFQGGLLTLKHILYIQPSIAVSEFDSIITTIYAGLAHSEDSVQSLTAELISSIEVSVQTIRSCWESKMGLSNPVYKDSFRCRWIDSFHVCLIHFRDVNLKGQSQSFFDLYPALCSGIQSCSHLLYQSTYQFIDYLQEDWNEEFIPYVYGLIGDTVKTCQRIMDRLELSSAKSTDILKRINDILMQTSVIWKYLHTRGVKAEYINVEHSIQGIMCISIRLFSSSCNFLQNMGIVTL